MKNNEHFGLNEESLINIWKIIEEMRCENASIPILVEGKRDKMALRTLGFEGEIITINSGKTLTSLADNIAQSYRNVIILTDWDKKGNYLAGRIFNLLRDNDVICDLEYRRKLGFYLGPHISTVEEIASLPSEKVI
jgi:5S rRNA maturation endonuclease (ribonuclease M5)